MLTINELAQQCAVATHVVRFYAPIGLIRPSRRHNGYRLFDKSEVARLGFIRAAKHLGFTLNEIRKITARADSGSSPCTDVRALMRERIVQNRARLDATLTQPARMEAVLAAWEEMPDRAPDGAASVTSSSPWCPKRRPSPRRRPEPQWVSPATKPLPGPASRTVRLVRAGHIEVHVSLTGASPKIRGWRTRRHHDPKRQGGTQKCLGG
ncbi:MAG: MerR family transcriptional regulator [Chromatiaceae bacterium]|jgi:DNA-binding transcriptional MerR regulator|nr:MerR family transcriptional regulator [Chromatiaceae bacterium]